MLCENFGRLSQQMLYERPLVGQGKDSKGRARKDPYDLTTIYVDDLTKALPFARRSLGASYSETSIFVDIRLAPSQRTVIAHRVTMRRYLLPGIRNNSHKQRAHSAHERAIRTING